MVYRQTSPLMTDKRNLLKENFQYSLPESLIAQTPLPDRTESRLLVSTITKKRLSENVFSNLPDLLSPGDLLVLNNTKVFRARLSGKRMDTGGKVEAFLLRELSQGIWKALIRPGRASRSGIIIEFSSDLSCTVRHRLNQGRAIIEFNSVEDTGDALSRTAQVPLPPYIKRAPDEMDDERYQTVYASKKGAVAAPTAGLHFDRELLISLSEKGIEHTYVTLHVGPGTFEPLRSNILEDNTLDPEEYYVSAEALSAIRNAREERRRIIAVGTTTTRVLETIDINSETSLSGETGIFIFPPYSFRNVDALITNFHLPESSLLCLVAAFMGYEFMMNAYRYAVEHQFRFYSYGDVMLIERESIQ